ncbi:MAG: cupin domain-containing protein [Shinella sp.]|nr:cupin domain-containing protein [Shinella sp.]
MSKALRFDISAIVPEAGRPVEDRIISGAPEFRSWNIEEADGGLYSGIWEATPGKWRIEYDEWEYFHITAGHSIVTSDEGDIFDLKAGDRLILKPGFKGTWEVVETTRKDYVIRVPGNV